MTLKLHTQTTFSKEIERIVRDDKVTYFEAVCDYMSANNIEPETVPKLLSARIKEIIEAEATDLNLINRGKKRAKFLL
jgi:Phage late-transcription coactivator